MGAHREGSELRVEETICEIVYGFAKEAGIERPAAAFDTETELAEWGINSLSFVELVIRIEDVFHIRFPEDKLLFSSVGTIGKLCDILRRLTGGYTADEQM